ncbi:MAG: methionine--tRNA ligase [Chthoniobacterales bacterium]
MQPESFFITTAIDYTNGAPHIGHAYEKVLADVIARYQRMAGREVFFLTGVDQHGQKVQQSAEKQGVAPQEFVDGVTAKFRALWDKLDVRYDAWAATTDDLHKECVRANLQMLWDDKDPATGESRWIYKKSEGGYYSVRQEQFLTDKERGEDGEFGPEWQPVEFREEENFYFRLKDHKQWLLNFIDKRSADGKPFVVPDFRVGELRNAVEKLDGDLCISRPVARLQWGIPFPESFGAGFVTYVWFDALVNYISFVPGHDPKAKAGSDSEFARWWPALHVIGKDIMIPAHGVYWPIMLKALGYKDEEMPTLLVHGWWNISGAKMSKSLGNVIDPDVLADKYGAEAVRYYLMSDIATGKDSDFSEERLIQRYNSDLANSLGNLLNRTLNMVAKYREGKLKLNSDVPNDIMSGVVRYRLRMESSGSDSPVNVDLTDQPLYQVNNCLACVIEMTNWCNQFIDSKAPWKLAKDPAQADQLDAVLYTLAESLRIIAILISPVLPKAAAAIFMQLNRDGPMTLAEATWGKLPDGHILGTPTPIFPRIQPPETAS